MLFDSSSVASYQVGGKDRYSAKRVMRDVNFFFMAPRPRLFV